MNIEEEIINEEQTTIDIQKARTDPQTRRH